MPDFFFLQENKAVYCFCIHTFQLSCSCTEKKDSALENLMGGPSSLIKSEEDRSCSPCISGSGLKRPHNDEDSDSISPSKSIKHESCEGDDGITTSASNDGMS